MQEFEYDSGIELVVTVGESCFEGEKQFAHLFNEVVLASNIEINNFPPHLTLKVCPSTYFYFAMFEYEFQK